MVRLSVTVLSQPDALVVVYVKLLAVAKYVTPFHIRLSHAVTTSVAVLLWLMVRWRVSVLGQLSELT